MECSHALEETQGDVERAVAVLRRRGHARALKKAGRAATHGFVVGCVFPAAAGEEKKAGGAAIITLCAETDFATRNDHFQKLCGAARQHLIQLWRSGALPTALCEEEACRPTTATASDASAAVSAAALEALRQAAASDVTAAASVLGENVVIESLTPLALPKGCRGVTIAEYVHGGVAEQQSSSSSVGRLVGLAAVESLEDPPKAVEPAIASAVARHFVATSGELEEEEGEEEVAAGAADDEAAAMKSKKKQQKPQRKSYVHQPFFGATPNEATGRVPTVGQWLKQHRLRLVKSLVLEYSKRPIVCVPPPAGPPPRL